MSWQTPIYDRTASDVAYARQHPEATTDLKGAWNVSDYLRAKNNLICLADALTSCGYPVTLQAMPEVTEGALGRKSYVQALTDNLQAVSDAFVSMSVPEPSDPWNWSKVNDLERMMAETKSLLTNMAAGWQYAGEVYAGEV